MEARPRALALELYRALNEDPAVPGLRVPTVSAAEDGTGLPPVRHDLDEAERSVVVVLADDEMVVEPIVDAGEPADVGQICRGLWAQCRGSVHRFIPVQLSENAWPLDPRGDELPARLQRSEASRATWVARALVVEICRFLQGEKRGDQLPMRLCFIGYWLCAKLTNEWRAERETGEVQRLLRQLQAIRVGTLKIAGQDSKRLLTQIPPELNSLLGRLGLLPLFAQPPTRAEV